MSKAPVKYTIFETMEGCNERRFIPFDDMPLGSSKYGREQVNILDMTTVEGRERITRLNPQPQEMQPDYLPNTEYNKKSLTKGAVVFGSMSSRKPNINKTYGTPQTYYTMQSKTAKIEHRPKIKRDAKSTGSDMQNFEMFKSGASVGGDVESKQSQSDVKARRSRFKSMGDHLQYFSKKITKAPFVSAMPISTDPAFQDTLSHRKRTNLSYVNFGRNQGRDNKVYHISDGYNLNRREDETYMDQYLAL